MRFLLFNWEAIEDIINDPSELTNREFIELAKNDGLIYNSPEEFQAAFNAEIFSVHTHQLRIIE